jgi:SAM-dependent methyltransferase
MEPLFRPVYDALTTSLEVGTHDNLLDVGCGAGLALHDYAQRGARVSGVDAAEGLLDIARRRVPAADLRHGSMTDLPWPEASFDFVTGVNAFVYADDGGLSEAFRVLKPGGRLGIGFWSDPMDFGWAMAALGKALGPHVGPASANTPLSMSQPNAARKLLADAGFEVHSSGSVTTVSEFADADIAYRALASTGMIYPLVQNGTEAALRAECLEQLVARNDPNAGIRMSARFGWLVAVRFDRSVGT